MEDAKRGIRGLEEIAEPDSFVSPKEKDIEDMNYAEDKTSERDVTSEKEVEGYVKEVLNIANDPKKMSLGGRRDSSVCLHPKSKKKHSKFFRNQERMSTQSEECDGSTSYPADCYSFLSLNGPSTVYFWFGLFVFLFQIAFLLCMLLSVMLPGWRRIRVDDNPGHSFGSDLLDTEASPLVRAAQCMSMISTVFFVESSMMDIVLAIHTFPVFSMSTKRDKVGCMVFSCVARLTQGTLATVVSVVLIFTTNNVIEIVLNLTALNFVSAFDDAAFVFAKTGKYGRGLEREAKRIDGKQLPVCMFRKYKHYRYWITALAVGLLMAGAYGFVVYSQDHPTRWETVILRVQIDNEDLEAYNGCYEKDFNQNVFKRDTYTHLKDITGDSNSTINTTNQFGFCIDNKRWYLFNGENGTDPCDAKEKTVIKSSKTSAYDISTVFFEDWVTAQDTPAELYFFPDGRDEEIIYQHCNDFLDDGRCDSIFNNAFNDYDGGDCCAASCSHSTCDILGLENAFNSTGTIGDGYNNCVDPSMRPVTIELHNFTHSRDEEVSIELTNEDKAYIEQNLPGYYNATPADTLLTLYCEGIKIIQFYINPTMEGQHQTVYVADGSNCDFFIENTTSSSREPQWDDVPIWYVNYTLYDGGNETLTELGAKKSKILEGYSYNNAGVSFDMVPECYINHPKVSPLFDTQDLYSRNDAESKAIFWLMGEGSVESKKKVCRSTALLERFLLAVLNFAAPISNSHAHISGSELETSDSYSDLWIQRGPLCRFPNLLCFGDDSTALNFHLGLARYNISGSIATEIGLLSNLVGFDASINMLTGSIPTEIGKLTGLKEIKLRRNTLTGVVPSEIGSLTSLIELLAYSNHLTGSIPTEIGLLTHLRSLNLYNNQLTGRIPSEIGLLTSLTVLRLGTNDLTGRIPTEIGLFPYLRVLDIDHNSFVGTIPTEIDQLTALERLYIGNNAVVNALENSIPVHLNPMVVKQCEICGSIDTYENINYIDSNTNDRECFNNFADLKNEGGLIAVEECDSLVRCIICEERLPTSSPSPSSPPLPNSSTREIHS